MFPPLYCRLKDKLSTKIGWKILQGKINIWKGTCCRNLKENPETPDILILLTSRRFSTWKVLNSVIILFFSEAENHNLKKHLHLIHSLSLEYVSIVHLFINFACLFVCLYPNNIKTAKPIRLKCCVGPHKTCRKVCELSK